MRIIYVILLLLSGFNLNAQFNCVDSGRISPMFQCNVQFYDPVCGCNGITYRNQCDAYNVHGVNNWVSGVCSGIDMDFYPNPITTSSMLTINLSFPEFVTGNVTIRIVDMYSKTWEQRFVNGFNKTSIQIDVSTLQTGVYFISLISSNGSSIVRQLCKA